ncbi:MAG: DUF1080 domain-containing protein [Opitutus sp.]
MQPILSFTWRSRLRFLSLLVAAAFGPAVLNAASAEKTQKPIVLFNGQNLDGWSVFIDRQPAGSDAGQIFQVLDGVIHVYRSAPAGSAQPFGYIATKDVYSHYRLKLEYRWGEKKFEPRASQVRDSGVLYHVGEKEAVWPQSIEFQIQERDVGDIYAVHTRVHSTLDPKQIPPDEPKQWGGAQYLPPERGGVERGIGGDWIARIRKEGTYEHEGWNTLEVVVQGDRAVHIVNGQVNNRCFQFERPDPARPGKFIPVKQGRIVLQAEGAEVLFRNIVLMPLDPTSAAFR